MKKIQTLEYGTYVERMVANKLKPLLDYASYQAESIIEEKLEEIDMKMVESYEVEWRPVIKIKLKNEQTKNMGGRSNENTY